MKLALIAFAIVFTYPAFSQERLDSFINLNNQRYKIHAEFDDDDESADKNLLVIIYRNGKKILADSLWSTDLSISFRDINEDGYKDLFVYQSTGFRPNNTYYLYLFRKKYNDFSKVPGFDEYPNVEITGTKGILSATFLSGYISYSFLRITSTGKLVVLANEGQTEDETPQDAYNRGFEKAKKARSWK